MKARLAHSAPARPGQSLSPRALKNEALGGSTPAAGTLLPSPRRAAGGQTYVVQLVGALLVLGGGRAPAELEEGVARLEPRTSAGAVGPCGPRAGPPPRGGRWLHKVPTPAVTSCVTASH